MIEAGAKEVPEHTMIDAIFKAHEVNPVSYTHLEGRRLHDDRGAAGDRGEDQRKDPRTVGRAQVTNTGGKNVRRNY